MLIRLKKLVKQLSQQARTLLWGLVFLTAVSAPCCDQVQAQSTGQIALQLVDSASGDDLSCRVQVRGAAGNLVKPKAIDTVQGWSLVDDQLSFRGRTGDYKYDIFHGPEYAPAHGQFTLDRRSEAEDVVELPRHADLASEGWYGGDLLSYLPPDRSSKWLGAEGLFLATSTSRATATTAVETIDQSSFSFVDDRVGSGLQFHHWLPDQAINPQLPSSRLLVLAKSNNEQQPRPTHAEIQKLWARDLPIWLASNRVDSVQLLSDHLTFDGIKPSPVKPPVEPEGSFSGPRGPGRMVEQIYWKMLDAGFRIPPTAGSGFGQTSSPLGYNRVYALVSSPQEDAWWQAIRLGNSFVTNGPLLRVAINGMPPGHRFQSADAVELDVGLVLTTSDPVDYLEVIHNGNSIYRAALDEYAKQGGKIPPLMIKQSGWLVVRVVTSRDFTYRFATTAPYYIEIDGHQRIDRSAVQFFVRWLAAAKSDIAKLPPAEQQLHEPFLQSAARFWNARLELAE